MSTSLWKALPNSWPSSGVLVWVRRLQYSPAFKATWNSDDHLFHLENGETCPWYILYGWRPL